MTETNEPQPYDFRFGTEPLAMLGILKPVGRRILCRAILESDYSTSPIQLALRTANEPVAFVVVAKGGVVDKAWEEMGEREPLEPGQVVEIKSVSADKVNPADPTGRYWLIETADVVGRAPGIPLWSENLERACEIIDNRQSMARAAEAHMPGSGEAELAPSYVSARRVG